MSEVYAESVPAKPIDRTLVKGTRKVTDNDVGLQVTTGGNVLEAGDRVTHADGDHGIILDHRNGGTEVLVTAWAEGPDMWVDGSSLQYFEDDAASPSSVRWFAERFAARHITETSLSDVYGVGGRFGPGDFGKPVPRKPPSEAQLEAIRRREERKKQETINGNV